MARNQTGKAGNDSGSTGREARGDSAGRTTSTRGKHPKNKLFVGPRQAKQQRRKRHRVGGY